MREVDSLASDSIEMGCLRIWIAVEACVQPRLIVRECKKNVWALARRVVMCRGVGESEATNQDRVNHRFDRLSGYH